MVRTFLTRSSTGQARQSFPRATSLPDPFEAMERGPYGPKMKVSLSYPGYSRKVTADTFMKSRNHDDNQRKAATLAGPRFVCTSEVAEEHRLNEQLIKDITGGDTIEARRLYQEAFTFKPQFKQWMYGNHKPTITGTDDAIWSRVRMVPFEVSFFGREDLELPAKLAAELSGILTWALRGCLDWQRSGLQPPAKVQAGLGHFLPSTV